MVQTVEDAKKTAADSFYTIAADFLCHIKNVMTL